MQYRSALPKSLDALRVFDAAVRHRSFSRAADELLVTQAAVSRRIQALEADLGEALFARAGRNIALTDAGRRLAASVSAALDYLEGDLAALRGTAPPPPVTIAAATSVSHLWLAAQLRARPELAVRVLTTDSLSEAAARSHDLTILYGRGQHPDWLLAPLMAERLQPVAAPELLARLGADDPAALTLAEIASLPLLDYARVRPNWVTLAAWFARAGHGVPLRIGRTFTSYVLGVEAAVHGDGVVLGSLELIAGHIASGALVPLGRRVEETGQGYHLGLRRDPPPGPEAVRLHAELLGTRVNP